jgi:hypothetical protein
MHTFFVVVQVLSRNCQCNKVFKPKKFEAIRQDLITNIFYIFSNQVTNFFFCSIFFNQFVTFQKTRKPIVYIQFCLRKRRNSPNTHINLDLVYTYFICASNHVTKSYTHKHSEFFIQTIQPSFGVHTR